jgi:hypothetical protein
MRITAIVIAALALTLGPALALDGPGRALVPSANKLQVSNDAILTGEPGSQIQRAFIPPYSGEVRVRWEVESADGSEVSSEAEVEHLDKCSRQTSGAGFKSVACKIRVAAGMPIIVTATPDQGTNTVSLRNVRLYYAVRDSEGEAIRYSAAPEICANKNWCINRTQTCGPTGGFGKCLITHVGKNTCAEILFQVQSCTECEAPNCTNCLCALAAGGGDRCNNGASGYDFICVRRVAGQP